MSSLLKDRVIAKTSSLGPITARIRPGLKVPTKATMAAAQNNPALAAILREVDDGRVSSREAEKKILGITEGKMKYPFTPRNMPYFTVKEADFSSPVLGRHGVELLLQMYGEERAGFPGKHLWRIPMVFADVGDVEKIFPSEYRVGQGVNMYRSEYINGVRHCMIRIAVDKEQNAKRKYQERKPESRGECNPDFCAEFASGACKFSGTLRFHIPGFAGIAPFVMGTTSTYAAEDIYRQLEQVIEKLGRIPRVKPDGSPIFWLVKSQKQRSYFDENNEKKTGLQWVPDLIADIDFPKLLELAERQPLIGVNRDLVPPEWLAPSVKVAQFVEEQLGRLNDSQDDVKANGQRQTNAPAQDLPDGNATSANVKAQPDATGSLEGDSSQDQGLSKIVVSDLIPASFSDMATQNNLTEVAGNWARLRFGKDWERDAVLKNQATVVLGKFLRGGREVTAAFLDLMIMVLGNQLDQEIAESFLKYRFGDKYFKDVGKLKKAKAMLIDLLESGKDVAQAYMRADIAKAA